MRIFADTSFLVAALVENHPHHNRTKPWVDKITRKEIDLGISSHSIAELYAILTSLPIIPRIPPGTALQMITENIIPNTHIVEFKTLDYLKCLRLATEKGFHGGIMYDLLIGLGFEKFKSEGLLTFNHKDFIRIFSEKKEVVIVP